MRARLEITRLERETGLRLAGELDLRTAPQLTEAFASIRSNGQAKLDLSELTFIDSSGLHAILGVASSVDGNGNFDPRRRVGVDAAGARNHEYRPASGPRDQERRWQLTP